MFDGKCNERGLNGQAHIIFPNGAEYEGECKDGERWGHGRLSSPDGKVYDGFWAKDKLCGYGIMNHPDGTKYEGQWQENKKCGHGRFTFLNGAVYDGMWKDNKCWGHGTLTHIQGIVYSGEWENGEPVHGRVTRNGQPWHGSQVDLLNGLHVIYQQKGEPFEQIHIIFADESRYEGGWKEGKRKGHGRYTLPTGAAYDGIWNDTTCQIRAENYSTTGTKIQP
jgi:hypothetical protein